MFWFYNISLYAFQAALQVAALFHPKARLWVQGRHRWRNRYGAAFQKKGRVLWVHAASLGEFEQGRPVIEAFRARWPEWQIVLSFFSPSGYEIRKNYPHADFIAYLPADTKRNARDFLDLIQPDAVIFVKYEFWANYLFELQKRGIPVLLVSALFRSGQPFFQWYGRLWRRMLDCFTQVFVQNAHSAALLRDIGFARTNIAGDTRVDRVLRLAETAPENGIVRDFAAHAPVLVVGSSWDADEAVLLPVLHDPAFRDWKVIIAPHEPSEKHLAQLLPALKRPAVRYSTLVEHGGNARAFDILIIDNIGMLNTLYRYGTLAWIGGGFGKGIHNTLEPAAFGLPVLFGPRFEKFEEARQFVSRGGAFPVPDAAALAAAWKKLEGPHARARAGQAVRAYLAENQGATEKVLQYFTEHFSR